MFNIDKELFRKTEGRLYRYYNQLKIIDKLKNRVVLLYKQKESILKEMKELNKLEIDTELNMGIDYSKDKIQSSGTGSSAAENETIRYIENLQIDYKETMKRLQETNSRIREIELEIQDMQYSIESLEDKEYGKLIELKYKELKTMDYIAAELYQSARTTAYRKRKEMVEELSQYIEWNKNGTKMA